MQPSIPSHRIDFKIDKKFKKENSFKWIRKFLFEMVNYIQINSTSFRLFAAFSKFYFFISIYTFSFLPHCAEIFPKVNLPNEITTIISTAFTLLYPNSNLNTIMIMFTIVASIFIIFAIIFFISAIIFRKSAKIPKFCIGFLSLSIIFGPIYFNILFLFLAHFTGDIFINGLQHNRSIAGIIILSFIIIIFFPFYYSFLCPTLYFKPKTIIFYSSHSEKYYYFIIHLYTFFSVAFSRGIESKTSIICTYIGSLILISLVILFFIFAFDFALMDDYYYHLPLLINSALTLLIINSIRAANYSRFKHGKDIFTIHTYILFCFLIFYFILILIARIVINMLKNKFSEKLDCIGETGIYSENQFFRLLLFGFEMNHPKCYDWDFFELAIKTHKTKRIMICFSKISAYYFNKDNNLNYAAQYFHQEFPHEISIKNFTFQIHSRLQCHSLSMEKSLRKELSRLHRKCLHCRSIMSYMWQDVVHNDLPHIDRLALNLHMQTQSIEESFAHILLNYSHNNIVAKKYAYFLSDVMQKQGESKYWKTVELTLRSGKKIKNERTQIISQMVMGNYLKSADFYISDKLNEEPTLDEVMDKLEELIIPKNTEGLQSADSVTKNTESAMKSHQQDAVQIESNNSKDDDERKRNQLEKMIKNVRLPSMKYLIILIFIIFSLIIPFLIIIPFLFAYNHASTSQTAFLAIIQSGSLAPSFIQALIVGFMTVVSNILDPLYMHFDGLNIPPYLWPTGWTNETTNEEIHALAANELRKRVTDFNSLISQVSLQKYYYDSIVAPFYADQFDYSVYDVNPTSEGNYEPVLLRKLELSMESILALYISLSYRITKFHDSDKWFYGQSQDFMNIEANSDVITQNLDEYTSTILNLALQDRKSHSNDLTLVLVATTVLIVAISIITWIIVTYFITKDSNKVYSILQFVPKNEISEVMRKLSPKEEEIDEKFDNKESNLRKNALRTLITPVRKYEKKWFSIVKFAITLLIIILSCLNLGVQIYIKNVSIDTPFNTAPLIYHCGKIHTQVGTVIHKILLYVSRVMMIEVNTTELLEDIDNIMNETLPNLDEFRYGSGSNEFYKGVNSINTFVADSFSSKLCDWPIDNFNSGNIFFCENYETSLSYILNYIRILMESKLALEYGLPQLYPIICWFFKNSYEKLVMPTENYLMEMFSEKILSYKKYSTITSIIIALTLFFIGLILTIIIPRVAYPVYNSLRILLFVDQNVIYASQPIMKLLSNDFTKFKTSSSKNGSITGYFDKYYDFISSIDDSVLIATNQGIITGANKSAVNFFANKNKTMLFQDENYTESESLSATQREKSSQNLWKWKFLHRKKSNKDMNFREYLLDDQNDNENSPDFDENKNSEKDSIIGKNITNVIQNKKFTRIFNVVQSQGFQPSFKISLSSDDSIHFTSIAVLHTGEVATSKESTTNCISFYCFVISDRIEKSNLTKLLEEETLKCRKIISSFFPEKLADYIQNGGSENVEIIVPNATVVFIEMIQFVPFYFYNQKKDDLVNDGNNNMDKMMKYNVLTKFINEIDRIIEKHPKMTRIKTMGGCYMAVGGIFDNWSGSKTDQQQSQIQQLISRNKHGMSTTNVNNVNNSMPASLYSLRSSSSHAIDAVSFALDAINAVQMLSVELNFPIRCRAGVHTCGPLSAGIVGDEDPSFEVIGSGISTALLMKEIAKPMTVHITDSVCNLIISGGFKIRESEDVKIGEKNVKCFIVKDYSNK